MVQKKVKEGQSKGAVVDKFPVYFLFGAAKVGEAYVDENFALDNNIAFSQNVSFKILYHVYQSNLLTIHAALLDAIIKSYYITKC